MQPVPKSKQKKGPKPSQTLDPQATEFSPKTSASERSESSSYEQICIICSEKRSNFCVGSCNHPICSICSLRMRHKGNDQQCSVCKRSLPFVISYAIQHGPKLFEAFGFDDVDHNQPGFDVDHSTNIVYHNCSHHYRDMVALRSLKCPIKSCSYTPSNNASLLKHFERDHTGSRLCSLCLEHRPIFITEQEIFNSENSLKKHCKAWGLDGKGHPLCEFCNKSFFDSNHLYRHMNETHITCHLCPASMSQRYYENPQSLSIHISNSHIICKHCERNGELAAFTTHSAYAAHMENEHGAKINPTAVYFNHQDRNVNYVDFQGNRRNATSHTSINVMASAHIPSYLDIPANMRISGRVTGSGNFLRDDADESLQAYIDDRASKSSSSSSLSLSRQQQQLAELFPPLQPTSSTSAATTLSDPLSRAKANTSSSALHPMSIVPSLQQQEAKRQQDNIIETQRQQELDERRSKRHEMLAEAFGVSSTVSSLRQLVMDMGLTSSYANATSIQHYMDILSSPLYPTAMIAWAAENIKEVVAVEKKLVELLGNKAVDSLQLKPMLSQQARTCVQMMAKYYGVNSYEYSSQRGKYISLVKCETSFVPQVLLSAAYRMKDAMISLPSTITGPANVYFTVANADLYSAILNKKVTLTVDTIIRCMLDVCRRYRSIHKQVDLIPFQSLDVTITSSSTVRILFHSHDYAMEVVRALKHASSSYMKDGISSFFEIRHAYDAMLKEEAIALAKANAVIHHDKNIKSSSPMIHDKDEDDVVNDQDNTDSWSLEDGNDDVPATSQHNQHQSNVMKSTSAAATSSPANLDDWELLEIDDHIFTSSPSNAQTTPSIAAALSAAAKSAAVDDNDVSEVFSAISLAAGSDVMKNQTSSSMKVKSSSVSESSSQKIGTGMNTMNSYGALSDDDEDDEDSEEEGVIELHQHDASHHAKEEQTSIEMECPSCSYMNIVSYEELASVAKCHICEHELLL